MRVLLDTHALLWWFDGAPELSGRAKVIIGDLEANEVLVSAASAWEIATKARIGKLPLALTIAHRLPEALDEQGFQLLPITVRHGHRAGWLQSRHADPFDRMLAAQSILEGIPIITTDPALKALGASVIW